MAVFARDNRRPARTADGVDAETIAEAHAASGQPIELRRLVDAAAVRADRVRRVIVAHDEKNIRPRLRAKASSDKKTCNHQSQSLHGLILGETLRGEKTYPGHVRSRTRRMSVLRPTELPLRTMNPTCLPGLNGYLVTGNPS